MSADAEQWSDFLSEDNVAIFLFHGVVDDIDVSVRNYNRKHVPKDYFVEFLSELKESGNPVSMDDIIDSRETDSPLPPRAFAVTFDDGFANNLSIAAPVLVDFGIPATFYVTSDFIDRNRMSWTDRIEIVMEQSASGHLALPWREVSFNSVEERIAVLDDIRLQVKNHATLSPDEVASSIQRQLGFDEIWSSDHPLDRKMTWSEVGELSSGEGLTVGGHSHSHAILSFLEEEELEREVDLSLNLLVEKAGIGTHHYSYPEGMANCYNSKVIEVLRSRGIRCSPTAIAGTNPADIDLFNLRRITVV